MAIFTNKELHEKILSSKAYRTIADNRNDKSYDWIPFINSSSITWSGWFKKYKKIADVIDLINKSNIKSGDDIIKKDVYESLYNISEEYKSTKDTILKPLVDIIKQNMTIKMANAVSQYDYLMYLKYPFKRPYEFYRIAQEFYSSALTLDGFKQNTFVNTCDEKVVNLFKEAVNDPDMYKSDECKNLFHKALESGTQNSKKKNDLKEILCKLEKKLKLKISIKKFYLKEYKNCDYIISVDASSEPEILNLNTYIAYVINHHINIGATPIRDEKLSRALLSGSGYRKVILEYSYDECAQKLKTELEEHLVNYLKKAFPKIYSIYNPVELEIDM